MRVLASARPSLVAMRNVSGPLTRTTARALRPGGVEMAAIVEVFDMSVLLCVWRMDGA
jgi:hypothetical protein